MSEAAPQTDAIEAKRDHVIIVEEGHGNVWHPRGRFASIKDAQTWLKTTAQPGTFHVLAFRYEDVVVKPPAPEPVKNVVDLGHQHLVRRVTTDGELENE